MEPINVSGLAEIVFHNVFAELANVSMSSEDWHRWY